MEKSQTDLLQQFQEEIAALKQRIEALESQIAAFQAGEFEADDEAVDFTDIEIGVEVADAPAEEPAAAPEPEPVAEPVAVPEETPDPIFAPEPEPAPVAEPEPAPSAPKTPAAEDDTARLPWRTDKPGLSVKNIRSGISLLDRALFIGTLFKEDFALYDQTIADLNAMSTLDEAVDYIREHFPSWNLKSDVVYHFMMSVRKKLG
jgi:TolA-binding protein